MCENALNEKRDMIKGETRPKNPVQLQSASASRLGEPISLSHEDIATRRPMTINQLVGVKGRLSGETRMGAGDSSEATTHFGQAPPILIFRPSTTSPCSFYCWVRDHILLLIQHDTVE